MTDRKFIMVVGMPRGGTSIVSKMLIELGVNMGESFVNSNHYPNYEDKGLHGVIGGYAAWRNEQARVGCVQRVRDYMLRRLDEVDGPVGAKFPCLSNLYGAHGWDTLPIRVIHVIRPLEEAIESDLKNYTGLRRDRAGKVERAAEYGRMWWSQQRFLEAYEPVWTVRHGIDVPSHTVDGLALSLGIETTALRNHEIAEIAISDPSKWRAPA